MTGLISLLLRAEDETVNRFSTAGLIISNQMKGLTMQPTEQKRCRFCHLPVHLRGAVHLVDAEGQVVCQVNPVEYRKVHKL